VHTPERQSVFSPHAAPVEHVGEHAGAAQAPDVQTPELQSPAAPHPAPVWHVGEHAGAAQ
jgi:hypothetical protein